MSRTQVREEASMEESSLLGRTVAVPETRLLDVLASLLERCARAAHGSAASDLTLVVARQA